MKKLITITLLILSIGAAGCETLKTTGKIIAVPVLTAFTAQLISDSDDWANTITIIHGVLDAVMAEQESPVTARDKIEAIVQTENPGSPEEREEFLALIDQSMNAVTGIERADPVATVTAALGTAMKKDRAALAAGVKEGE